MEIIIALISFLGGCAASKAHEVYIRRALTSKIGARIDATQESLAATINDVVEIRQRLADDGLPTERLDTLERRFESLHQDVLRHTNKITKALSRERTAADSFDGPQLELQTEAPEVAEPETDADRLRKIRQMMKG